jgi:hypothetical protein
MTQTPTSSPIDTSVIAGHQRRLTRFGNHHSSLKSLRQFLPGGALLAAATLVAALTIAPANLPTAADELQAYLTANAQSLIVHEDAAMASVIRDTYSATPGIATLAAGGTNHDWAKLVLLLGAFPMTENNITVMTRWMRQENFVDSWWNRNNPLNNGWGSGGGGGLGSYDSLITAAENAAEALHGNPGYGQIVASFMASAPTEVTEAAIWASPWASGHYNDGKHWAYFPVPVVKADPSAWGQ